jgi:hypothetical protein
MKNWTPRERKSDSGNFKPVYEINHLIWGTRLSLVMYSNAKKITRRLVNPKEAQCRFRGVHHRGGGSKRYQSESSEFGYSVCLLTDLSLRKAAGDAMFKFLFDLVDLGISIQHKISPTARAAYVLDRFSIAPL